MEWYIIKLDKIGPDGMEEDLFFFEVGNYLFFSWFEDPVKNLQQKDEGSASIGLTII